MVPGPILQKKCQFFLVGSFALVNEHLDDVLVRHQLRRDDPCRGLMRALLVDRLSPRHSQCDNDVTVLFLDQ